MKDIAKIVLLAQLVKKGKIALEKVPTPYREEVEKILNEVK